MGWSDPDIIAQMDEAARNPQPPYEKEFKIILSGCDEMERSPDVSMQVCARLTRGFAAQVLEMERAESKGELQRSADMLGGIMLAVSSCLAALFDTGTKSLDRAIKGDFIKMLDEAIKERARQCRR